MRTEVVVTELEAVDLVRSFGDRTPFPGRVTMTAIGDDVSIQWTARLDSPLVANIGDRLVLELRDVR